MRTFVTGGSGFIGRNLIAALVREGHGVRALARSERAAQAVRDAGAEAVAGDLDDVSAMATGMRGCDVVFHAAASTKEWAPYAEFHAINVTGTAHVVAAAKQATVPRLVHVSTEAVLLDGSSLARVDETRPIPPRPIGHYPRTKALAEKCVLAANGPDLAVIVVRPRFVWGRGDTTVLPKIVDLVNRGRFSWISGGNALTSTCHVANVCQGLILAAERGRPGGVYFLTDGPPVTVRSFLTAMLGTQGLTIGDASVPRAVAYAAAVVMETVWGLLRLRSTPPVQRTAVLLIGREVTVDDSRARRELGYTPLMSRDAGLAELSG